MEFLFVGHPKGSLSIPWIDEPDWKIDLDFAKHIRQLMLGGAHVHRRRLRCYISLSAVVEIALPKQETT